MLRPLVDGCNEHRGRKICIFVILTKIVMYLEMVLGRPVVTMDHK